jgi:hypothetical protein
MTLDKKKEEEEEKRKNVTSFKSCSKCRHTVTYLY